MSFLETIRQVITPGASYPMVTLFPGGPIGNDVGLNPAALPGGGAVPEPPTPGARDQVSGLPTPTGGLVPEPGREQGKRQIANGKGQSGTPDTRHLGPDTFLRGAVGTANFAGFLRDLGEYNPILEGRNAFLIYEKMRRSDADVKAALLACKLPIRAADYQIVPGRKPNEPGFELAKSIAEEVRENLLGGLESPTNTGCWVTQNFEMVKENALLCLDFGCAAHEDLWHIDGDKVRLRKLAPRLPYTFYRYHVDQDGESLLYLEQYGYRGNNFVNVLVPAEKIAYFVNDMEGAYFYGRSVLRAAYQHWYIKSQLYRIDAISIERNGLGVPTIKQGPNVSMEDRKAAQQWVEMLAAHESTGLSLPNGWEFLLTGISGRLRDPQASIQHHSEMIMRSVLANFLTLGTTQTGSRALGGSMRDFFYLSLEALSRKIDETISNTSMRRLVDYNFTAKPGERLPYPRLITSNILVANPLELMEVAKDVASANVDLLQPDDDTENWIRKKVGLPLKSKAPRPRYAPIVQRVQEEEQGEIPVEPGEKLEQARSDSSTSPMARLRSPSPSEAEGTVPAQSRREQSGVKSQNGRQQAGAQQSGGPSVDGPHSRGLSELSQITNHGSTSLTARLRSPSLSPAEGTAPSLSRGKSQMGDPLAPSPQPLAGCGKTRCGTLCSAGILPASDESKGVAGWKPALRAAPKEFFRSLLVPTVYMIRHPHTRFNSPDEETKHGRLRGLRNVPLDEKGLAEAKELAQWFRDIKLRVIFSSPLERASAVAFAMGEVTGAPVKLLPGLLPRDWGELSGRKVEDVLPQLEELRKHPERAPKGGESANDFWQRATKGIERVLAEAEDSHEPVAAVTHSSLMELTPIVLSGGDPQEMEMEGRAPCGAILKCEKHGANWQITEIEPADELKREGQGQKSKAKRQTANGEESEEPD